MTEPDITDRLKQLPHDIRVIVETRIQLWALEIGEKISSVSGKAIVTMVILFIAGLGILFAMLALAMFLGDVLRNPAGGFMIVAVMLFVFAFFCWLLLPKLIEQKVKLSILNAILEPKTELKSNEESKSDE